MAIESRNSLHNHFYEKFEHISYLAYFCINHNYNISSNFETTSEIIFILFLSKNW